MDSWSPRLQKDFGISVNTGIVQRSRIPDREP